MSRWTNKMKKYIKYILISSVAVLFSVMIAKAYPSFNNLGNYAGVGVSTSTPSGTNFTASGTIAFPTLSSTGNPCLVIGSNGLISTSTCGSGSGFTTSTLAGLTSTSWNLFSTTTIGVTTSSPNNIYIGPAVAYQQVLSVVGNLTLSNNVLNTIQDIQTTSSPTFASGTFTGNVNIGNYTILTSSTMPTVTDPTKIYLHAHSTNGIVQAHVHSIYTENSCDDLIGDNCLTVKNNSGGNLTAGQVVYINGGSGANALVGLAQANSTSTSDAIGLVATTSVSNNGFLFIVQSGDLANVDTSAFAVGDILYLSTSTAGGLTNVRPTYPYLVKRIGKVLRSNINNGVIDVNIGGAVLGMETGTISPTFNIGGSNAVTTSSISSYALVGATSTNNLLVVSSSTGILSLTATTTPSYTSLTIPSITNSFVATDGNGKLIATSTPAGGSGTPGGSTTQIQYNNGGAFGGDSNLTYTSSTPKVSINATSSKLIIGNSTTTVGCTNCNFYNQQLTQSSSTSFSYSGVTTTFTIPQYVTSITITGIGAGATNSNAGHGGMATGTLAVSTGQIYTILIGGAASTSTGGFGGGGTAQNAAGVGGGGMTWISSASSFSTSTVILVAAGGGGAVTGNNTGGDGGLLTGLDGTGGGTVATGGTQTAGGTGGTGTLCNGTNGSAGQGGDGGAGNICNGGGGGYYGGGGSGVSSGNGGGAAGGSSFLSSSLTSTSTATTTNLGNGSMVISYNINNPPYNSISNDNIAMAVGGKIITGEPQNATTTVSTCGTNPSLIGNSTAGKITFGTGGITACTLNFGIQYLNIPVCTATLASSTAAYPYITSESTSSVIFTTSATMQGGTKLNYMCLGY